MKILVIGDLILDCWHHAAEVRGGTEVPTIPVFVEKHVDRTLGGAGAVANLLAGFGAEPTLLCQLGRDDNSLYLRPFGIKPAWITGGSRVSQKHRFIGSDGQQIGLRQDIEEQPSEILTLPQWLDSVLANEEFSLAMVADYGKGLYSGQWIMDRLLKAGIPVLVDPARGKLWENRYRGANVIKANFHEAVSQSCVNPGKMVADAVVVTNREHPVFVNEANINHRYVVQPFQTKEVDVTGAGDAFFAAMGYGLASGMPLRQACVAGCAAGAMTVSRLGIARLDWGEVIEKARCRDARMVTGEDVPCGVDHQLRSVAETAR